MKRLIVAAVVAAAGFAFADSTPVMVSLLTPVQAPSSDYDVAGLRLSLIYGQCERFKGIDIGIANRADRDYTGLGIGGANIAGGKLIGGQVGLVNWNGADTRDWAEMSKGAQIGLVNYAGTFCGLQDGVVNISDEMFTGMQSGLLNFSGDFNGFACGFYFLVGANFASGTVSGLQVGLVNYAAKMNGGIQIGLVNIVGEGGWMPVFPIVNGDF